MRSPFVILLALCVFVVVIVADPPKMGSERLPRAPDVGEPLHPIEEDLAADDFIAHDHDAITTPPPAVRVKDAAESLHDEFGDA